MEELVNEKENDIKRSHHHCRSGEADKKKESAKGMDIDRALQKEEKRKEEESRKVHEQTSFQCCVLACCET